MLINHLVIRCVHVTLAMKRASKKLIMQTTAEQAITKTESHMAFKDTHSMLLEVGRIR